jgi:hypothetical protein
MECHDTLSEWNLLVRPRLLEIIRPFLRFDPMLQREVLRREAWMWMSEYEAEAAMWADFGVPLEAFQRFYRLRALARDHLWLFLDVFGSRQTWSAQNCVLTSDERLFGVPPPSSAFRTFYDEVQSLITLNVLTTLQPMWSDWCEPAPQVSNHRTFGSC